MVIRLARYLGVSPWELEEAPAYWLNQALICQNAENWAENERQAHAMAKVRNQR